MLTLEEFKDCEPLYAEAAEFAKSESTMSISKMQRKLRLGYNRAARLCERLQADGVLIFNNMEGGWSRAPNGTPKAS
jgi:DNA segregation ATPase FtsK/SpoIIIE-like protein